MKFPISGSLVGSVLLVSLTACDNQSLFQEELDAINTWSVDEVHRILRRPYRSSITESMLSNVRDDFGKIEFAGGLFERAPPVVDALSIPNGFSSSASFGLCERYNNNFSSVIEGENGEKGIIIFSVLDSRSRDVCGIQILLEE